MELLLEVCSERGGCPSIYTRLEAVLEAKFGASTGLHHLCMPSCHRLTKGRQRGTGRGSPAPRGQLPPDLAPSPPPLRRGMVLGPGLLLCWWLAQVLRWSGPFILFLGPNLFYALSLLHILHVFSLIIKHVVFKAYKH